jgi:hypothetical protein
VRTPEIPFRRKIQTGVALLCASVALSGCTVSGGEQDPVKDRQLNSDTVSDRYYFDYGGDIGAPAVTYKVGCLDSSPYKSEHVVVRLESNQDRGTVVVTPDSVGLRPLHFNGLHDYELPLQPTDGYTAQVLEGAGCDTSQSNHAAYF